MQNTTNYTKRSTWSLISPITKVTVVVILLDVVALVTCSFTLPNNRVREPLLVTSVALLILVVLFFVSLLRDSEFIADYYSRRKSGSVMKLKVVSAEPAESLSDTSKLTVSDRVVGIKGLHLVSSDGESLELPSVDEDNWRNCEFSRARASDGSVRATVLHVVNPNNLLEDLPPVYMSVTINSRFSTSTRISSSVSPTATAAGRPGVSTNSTSGTCSLNVQDDNSAFGPVVWANCCAKDNPALNCPPQTQIYPTCPIGWSNCADPETHREMCTLKTEKGGYTDGKPLNKKCCPKNFSCGIRWTSPCELIPGATNATAFPPFTSPPKVITNALHLKASGVFAGCNDASEISPSAVGGLVAIGILALCVLCALLMLLLRRRLLRDPLAIHWSLNLSHFSLARARSPKVAPNRRGRANVNNLEITVMKECQVEEKTNGNRNFFPGLPNLPLSALWVDIGDAARMSRLAAGGSVRSGSVPGTPLNQ